MTATPAFESRQPQPALAIRRTVPLAEVSAALEDCLPAVFEYLIRVGRQPAGAPFTRYLAMSDAATDFEAGIPVDREAPGEGAIVACELPGGDVAVLHFFGPYDGLPGAHRQLTEFIAASGRTASGAPWESYLTDPVSEPDPAKWETVISYPLSSAPRS